MSRQAKENMRAKGPQEDAADARPGEMDGLPEVTLGPHGYVCGFRGCTTVDASLRVIQNHRRRQHGLGPDMVVRQPRSPDAGTKLI